MSATGLVVEDVLVAMRDGVRLAADVVVCDDGARHPALLMRTPYGRPAMRAIIDVDGLARAGWAVVIQDTRGRSDSEGVFDPFHQERGDGADTVDWCGAQTWSDGRVAMTGGSYVGLAQLLCALERPPALRAIAPMMAPSDIRDGFVYEGGAFQLGLTTTWATIVASGDPRVAERDRGTATALAADPATLQRSPLRHMPVRDLFRPFERWLDPHDTEYWNPISISRHLRDVDVPGYHLGGWYDVFCEGTIDNYVGTTLRARSERARRTQRLIVGPWTHAFQATSEVDFGPDANPAPFIDAQYEWLRQAIDGEEVDGGVSVFVMGANRWHHLPSWPPSSTPWRLHLDAGPLGANGAGGDGRLCEALPAGGRDVFPYDPDDPVPTRGGRPVGGWPPFPGAVDQRPVEERRDVLVYTSEVLDTPVTAMGMVTAEVVFATTGKSADVAVKLCDLHPDGRVFNVVDGVRRSTFTPGRRKVVGVDLGSTAMTFLPGHRIRVEVASSNFPRFDRNPATGEPSATATRLEATTQTVVRGGARPSAIVLPIVRGSW